MWKFVKSDQIDTLQKSQQNLEAAQENLNMSQKNNQQMMTTLTQFLELSQNEKNKIVERSEEKETIRNDIKSEKDKLKAAYALNLCTVSVSQIIDYDDIFFLENEYEAILNNLNLEEMPKDEALLRILKQLMDVITFFRIQEGDKKIMQVEYENKMKNAIWSAVPNFGMIVAGGNPVTMAISLASQVGIGYMNYRKEKAKNNLEKQKQEWELQRSAMEQFNGLRRELFDTAWRLADEYNFPDEYRLTERQITQYNNILMDTDDMRKYERLDYIKNNFKAYPQFWYYIGNAANSIYNSDKYDDEIRNLYKQKALEHFKYFLNMTEKNILREDQIIASCALETVDLIDNKAEKTKLLERAAKESGNALDVIELCAMGYLKIGESEKAARLFRMLVNENYNERLNSQILSKIYVSQYLAGNDESRKNYITIASRVKDQDVLFPMPDITNKTIANNELEKQFLNMQRKAFYKNYAFTMEMYINKCENNYIGICFVKGNITEKMGEFIKNICSAFSDFPDKNAEVEFSAQVCNSVSKLSKDFRDMLENDEKRIGGKLCVKFSDIFEEGFMLIAKKIINKITELDMMDSISTCESDLYDFCIKNNLNNSVAAATIVPVANDFSIEEQIFGAEYLKTNKKVEKCLEILKHEYNNRQFIAVDETSKKEKLKLVLSDNVEFKSYWERHSNIKSILNEKARDIVPNERSIIAIIDDKTFSDIDLIATTEGVAAISRHCFFKGSAPYEKIKLDSSGEKLQIGDYKYGHSEMDISAMQNVIKLLADVEKGTTGGSLANEIKERIASNAYYI